MDIFGETNVEQLNILKDIVLANEEYEKRQVIVRGSLDYYICFVESRPIITQNDPYLKKRFPICTSL